MHMTPAIVVMPAQESVLLLITEKLYLFAISFHMHLCLAFLTPSMVDPMH